MDKNEYKQDQGNYQGATGHFLRGRLNTWKNTFLNDNLYNYMFTLNMSRSSFPVLSLVPSVLSSACLVE